MDARQHSHSFLIDNTGNEKHTLRVAILTAVMMVAEIAGGLVFSSMALMADGFHMGTHAFALGLAVLVYRYARRNAGDPTFNFGTGKVIDLGGYTSALLLLVGALIMAYESVKRFLQPAAIQFNQAILITCVGLAVNLLSAWILRERRDHHGQESSHRDRNIRGAYLHVLADALTSILAIAALLVGKLFGWVWMDPVMGVVGAVVIARWSAGLLRETSAVLLDKVADRELIQRIRERIDGEDRVDDVHLWQIGPSRYALILSIHSSDPKPVEHYRSLLAEFPDIAHATIEIINAADQP